MPLKIGEEKTFDEARSKPSIVKSKLSELEAVLRLIMLKVGLRAENIPSPEEKAALIDHILQHYGNHTIEEIRLAFDMAMALKLNIAEKEITCYENFSCLYFSKIMNAYRAWASEVHKYISHKKPVMIEGCKELTDEEWEEWLPDIEKYEFKILPCSAYDYLTKKGKICLSKQEKFEYMERSVAYLTATIPVDSKEMIDFAAMKKEGVFSAEVTATLITFSKRLALQDYFNKKNAPAEVPEAKPLPRSKRPKRQKLSAAK